MTTTMAMTSDAALLDRLPLGAFRVARTGVVSSWNGVMEDWTGRQRADVVGVALETLFPKFAEPRYALRLQPLHATGGVVVFSSQLHGSLFEARLPGGALRVQQTTVTALPSEDSVGFDALFVVQDVTDLWHRVSEYRASRDRVLEEVAERKRIEEQLRTKQLEAEASNRAKSEFLANVSHEIRTPMNGILGMAELLRSTRLDATQRDFVDTISNSGDALLQIINDLLDFSKMEAGRIDLDLAPFGLPALLDQVRKPFELAATRKGVGLFVKRDATVPEQVIGDSGRLRQVLINLIGNALKFTSAGHVTVHVSAAPDRDDPARARVTFAVRDTGIGIPREAHQRIFEAFTQADGSTTRRFGGAGLGLTICRRLVVLMGGDITVDSVPDQGSTFAFTIALPVVQPARAPSERLSLSAPPTAAKPSAAPRAQRSLRVLLAEDNAVNRIVATRFLESAGHTVVAVPDGGAAIAAATSSAFDVVLMDVHMPDIDGIAATLGIRAHEAERGGRVPIIALTADAMVGDRERCLAAGMDDHLAKPFPRDALLALLLRHAGPPRSAKAEPSPAAPA